MLNASLSTLTTIKRRSDFLAANATTQRYVTGSFILLANKRADNHPISGIFRIGYTVTKKMGNAVARNFIKRRLREAVRRIPDRLLHEQYDYILIARHKSAQADFSTLRGELEIAFSRIHANKSAKP